MYFVVNFVYLMKLVIKYTCIDIYVLVRSPFTYELPHLFTFHKAQSSKDDMVMDDVEGGVGGSSSERETP